MTSISTLFGLTARSALGAAVLAAGVVTMTPAPADAQNFISPKNRYGGYGRPGFAPQRAYGPRAYAPRAHGYRHHGGWRGHRGNRGAAVAAGIIGGLAVGALIAGAAQPAYAAPTYSYGAPVYGHGGYVNAGHYGYQPQCYWQRVRQHDGYGGIVVRRVQVCE
jgi:hypothetical protein